MWDLVPWPGIKPRAPTLGARSLSHWTTREVPGPCFLSPYHMLLLNEAPPRGTSGKEPTCQYRTLKRRGFDPRVWEDPLKKKLATHSSILAWRIPWTEEPGGLQSMGSQRVGHDWSDWAHPVSFCWQPELGHGHFGCVSSAVATALSHGTVSIWRTGSDLWCPDLGCLTLGHPLGPLGRSCLVDKIKDRIILQILFQANFVWIFKWFGAADKKNTVRSFSATVCAIVCPPAGMSALLCVISSLGEAARHKRASDTKPGPSWCLTLLWLGFLQTAYGSDENCE